jgi:hypothetical protein
MRTGPVLVRVTTSRRRPSGSPSRSPEPDEVGVEGDDLRAVLDGDRGEVGVAHEAATGSESASNPASTSK